MFTEAYKEEILPTFSFVSNSQIYIAKFNESLGVQLRYVSELNLSRSIKFADDILRYFSKFENLKSLYLDYTYLSDEGLRLMLSNHRVFKTGFKKLQELNLRGTHLVGKNLVTILGFPKLKYLSFSVYESIEDTNSEEVCKKITSFFGVLKEPREKIVGSRTSNKKHIYPPKEASKKDLNDIKSKFSIMDYKECSCKEFNNVEVTSIAGKILSSWNHQNLA